MIRHFSNGSTNQEWFSEIVRFTELRKPTHTEIEKFCRNMKDMDYLFCTHIYYPFLRSERV